MNDTIGSSEIFPTYKVPYTYLPTYTYTSLKAALPSNVHCPKVPKSPLG
jgi:hypothetical protein